MWCICTQAPCAPPPRSHATRTGVAGSTCSGFFSFLSSFGAIRNPAGAERLAFWTNSQRNAAGNIVSERNRSGAWTAASRSHVDRQGNCTSASRSAAFHTFFNSLPMQRDIELLRYVRTYVFCIWPETTDEFQLFEPSGWRPPPCSAPIDPISVASKPAKLLTSAANNKAPSRDAGKKKRIWKDAQPHKLLAHSEKQTSDCQHSLQHFLAHVCSLLQGDTSAALASPDGLRQQPPSRKRWMSLSLRDGLFDEGTFNKSD